MGLLRVGIVGAGNISGIYCKNLGAFPSIDLVAISDLDRARAQAKADEHNIQACSIDEMLGDPSIDLILNITIPSAHGSVGLAVLNAGKSVYNEKPLTIDRPQAQEMLSIADPKGLYVGCAPDTFLGGSHQHVREIIEAGIIGTPVAVHGYMTSPGVESWHPDPEFFYKKGAGPLLDMGPYYLTAMVNMFGAIESVSSVTRTTFAERTVASEPKKGEKISVETPTYIGASFHFASGVIGQLTTTFDTYPFPGQPHIVVYGSTGVLVVPDPNFFGGVILHREGWNDPVEIAHTKPFTSNSRGLGILDIAHAREEGRPARASGELAFHVLDAMLGILEAGDAGTLVRLKTSPKIPAVIGDSEFAAERDTMSE